MPNYYSIAKQIVNYLCTHQQANGTIYDHVNGIVTPDSQYGLTFFALAALIIGQREEDTQLVQNAEKALDYYFNIPKHKIGANEFNNFALLLIYQHVSDIDYKLVGDLESRLKDYIAEMKYLAYPGSGISNNIFAIRAACHLLKGNLFDIDSEVSEAQHIIENYILRWQSKDGFFYDYPDDVDAEDYATPLTYHAKICAMLCLCYELAPKNDLLAAIIKGLEVLGEFIAPEGEAFYYGRSNNTIFGYASAIFAYEKAATFIKCKDITKAQRFRGYAERLLQFLQRWQHDDGHISVVTNDYEENKVGWDVYVYNVVYNAYTAGMLMLLCQTEEELTESQARKVEKDQVETKTVGGDAYSRQIFHAPDAGLLKVETSNFFLALSTKGQSITKGSIFFNDLRYHGMSILTLKSNDETLIPPPPLMWNLEHRNDLDLVDPRYCGFQPFFEYKGQLAAVRVYDDVVFTEQDKAVAIFASGQPTIYQKPHPLRSIISKVTARYHFSKVQYFLVKPFQGIRFHYTIVCLPSEPLLIFISVVEKEKIFKSLQFSDFSVRFSGDNFQIDNRRVRCNNQDNILCFSKIFPEEELSNVQKSVVCTSRGYANVLYQITPISETVEDDIFINGLYLNGESEELPRFELAAVNAEEIQMQIYTRFDKYNLLIQPKEKRFKL